MPAHCNMQAASFFPHSDMNMVDMKYRPYADKKMIRFRFVTTALAFLSIPYSPKKHYFELPPTARGIPREEIFVAGKLGKADHYALGTLRAIQQFLGASRSGGEGVEG